MTRTFNGAWRALGVAAVVSVGALVAACSGTANQGIAPGTPAPPVPITHVHGIARNPGDGIVYLATHEGLFRLDRAGYTQVGPVIDLMGFTVAGPGHFYASGHPGAGVNLPQPAGLLESTDAGHAWHVRSRAAQSDFHALTVSPRGVVGFDGVLRSTVDGTSWRQGALGSEPAMLAASPDGTRVLATTQAGLQSSDDQGATWHRVAGAPLLQLVAWADKHVVVGVTPDGRCLVSRDRGRTWTLATGRLGQGVQALSAGRHGTTLEVLAATNSGVRRSTDLGATFTDVPG